MPLKIISGGQTGVDRAALDAALSSGVPCGGWCPRGRRAEDGPIPLRYPLTELAGGYIQRTRRNVEDSEGTAVIYFGELEGGTALTVRCCHSLSRPVVLVDATKTDSSVAARTISEFVDRQGISVLNVAGPRASRQRAAYLYTLQVMGRCLQGG